MALQNAQSIGFFRSLLKVATDTEREGVMQGINPALYSALTQVLRASKYIKKLNVETAQELISYITDAEKLQSIKDTDKPAVAMMTLRAVMEMDRTVPVGPDTHMNCMKETWNLGGAV